MKTTDLLTCDSATAEQLYHEATALVDRLLAQLVASRPVVEPTLGATEQRTIGEVKLARVLARAIHRERHRQIYAFM